MNKSTRGAVAAATGAALLLGGAGSLAYWSDSVGAGTDTISSGQLGIKAAGDGTWTDNTNGAKAAIEDAGKFHMVPGDTVTYSRAFTVTAVGDDLEAKIAADGVVSSTDDLSKYVDVETTLTGTETDGVVTSADNGSTVTVTVAVAFDPGAEGQVGEDDTLDLSKLAIDLQQVQGDGQGN
ncbi:MAG: alternate-type signal peptide domain-containing protein [Nocardioidaceae bacterium]